MGLFCDFVRAKTNKKFLKKPAVTFSTRALVCLHSSNIRSPQGTCSLRESRLTVGSAEGAGAIGGLAPAPFVFVALHSRSYF